MDGHNMGALDLDGYAEGPPKQLNIFYQHFITHLYFSYEITQKGECSFYARILECHFLLCQHPTTYRENNLF